VKASTWLVIILFCIIVWYFVVQGGINLWGFLFG